METPREYLKRLLSPEYQMAVTIAQMAIPKPASEITQQEFDEIMPKCLEMAREYMQRNSLLVGDKIDFPLIPREGK